MNVYILLDRSGSMAGQWNEAVNSVNAYVKELPKKTNVFAAVFDHDFNVVRNTTVAKWENISADEFPPRGNTRLFDSAARVMQRAIDDNSEKTVIVVMTDGEENSSQHFKQADVKNMVKVLESKKWEILFLGANFDKVGDVATNNFGLAGTKFTNMTNGNMQDYMSGSLANATRAYVSGSASAINISDADKLAATGKK